MNSTFILDTETDEQKVFDSAFLLHHEWHDLVLKKSGNTFSVLVKNTRGCLHFHEQEIAEQFDTSSPTLDHFLDYIRLLYKEGLNLKRTRDYQVKLLVEACPLLFQQ